MKTYLNYLVHKPKQPTRKQKQNINNRIIDFGISLNINKNINTKRINYDISDHFPIEFKIDHCFNNNKPVPSVFNRNKLENIEISTKSLMTTFGQKLRTHNVPLKKL